MRALLATSTAFFLAACGSTTPAPPPAADPPDDPSRAMSDSIEILHDFRDPRAAAGWRNIDDRVMGGVSLSRLQPTANDTAVFAGELSRENNGGFASVRSAPERRDLFGREGLALRVRGDGRRYDVRIRTHADFDGVSYCASFPTTAGEWTTAQLPFAAFEPRYRGRAVPEAGPLDLGAVTTLGLLVAGDQEGEFALEVEWIGAYGSE